MPFSFLNPWLWLGALAVAVPLWLHLRRKKRTDILLFSALRFLDDQPEPRRSPMRLRHLLLLALRLLGLVLVVAAFAWPYLRRADSVPIKESRVYILDNTLSHQAKDGFLRARAQMVGELERAANTVQVAVVELTSAPRVLVSFGDDRQTARQRLQELQPSFQRGSYLAAFRQAGALVANSLGQKKRIILLADNQQNQWNENVNTPPFLRNVEVELPKASSPKLPNLSLAEPRAQRIFLGDKSLINFTAKLGHAGEAKTATVSLRANGQLIFNRSVDLDQQPETILLQAQWEAAPDAWLKGELMVEGGPDALAGDNRAYFSLAPVREGKVELLAQSQHLRLALSPDIMRGQWATHLLAPSDLSSALSATEDADLICLESNYLQSGDVRKLVWRYLTNGRGVVLLVNRVTPGIKGYLGELGFEAEESVELARDKAEKFQFVSFNHPVFHPFLSPDYGNLLEIKVWQYAELKPASAMPLIFSEKGAALFFQGTKFPGKLFVAAFGLDREHTTWPVHQSFIPFLDLMLQSARAEDPTPTNFEPGEITQVQLPGRTGEVILRNEQQELARTPVESGKAQVRMPEKPGLYSLSGNDGSKIEKVFSVNPSPKESELVYVDAPEAVKIWQAGAPAKKSAASTAQARLGLRGILQQRLWWWMVLAGLLTLMLEMTLTGMKKEGA